MSNEIKIEKRLIESAPGSFIFEFDNEIPSDKCMEIIERFEESNANGSKLYCIGT